MRIVRAIKPHFKVENKGLDLSGYIRQVNTFSSLKNAASSFSVQLSFANSSDEVTQYNLYEKLYKTLQPNDVVNIGIEKPGLMIGLIDRVAKTKEIGLDKYSRGLEVSGRCFGKLLISDNIEYSPQLDGNLRAEETLGKERLQFLGTFFRGYNGKKSQFAFNSPICAILYILKNIPSVHIDVPYTDISGDGNTNDSAITKLGKYFICDLKAWLSDQVVDTMLSQFSGQIWNYMEMCIDKNFYEMFIDTVPTDTPNGREHRPCLFLRPKPFDRMSDPTQKFKEAAKLESSQTEDKPAKEREEVLKYIAAKNYVIYPDITRGDIVFDNKKIEGTSTSRSGENVFITTYVSIAGLDDLGKPKQNAPQFTGERNIENPKDPENKSMVIPWTWDGEKSFYRTMVTDEPYHVITEDMILSENMGISDNEVINYITFVPRKNILTNTPEAQFGHLYPLIDAGSIQKYGLRSYHAESNLISQELLTPDNIKNYVKDPLDSKDYYQVSDIIQGRERLFCWYRYNPIYEDGAKTIKGNEDIRKGDKVYFPDALSKLGNKGIYAYVQAVRNTCIINRSGVSYRTTLDLIRGENPLDIEIYRAEKNREVHGLAGKKVKKLGTTYKEYDDSWGAPFDGKESFDPEGNSNTPGAHNVLKFDTMVTDKIKTGAGKIDNISSEEVEPETSNNSPRVRVPKKPKNNSEAKEKVLDFIEKKIIKIVDDRSSSRINDLIDGYGQTSGGPRVDINPAIYEYLAMLGSVGLPFPIELISVATGHSYSARGGKASPHSRGDGIDVTVAGRPTRGQKAGEEHFNKLNQIYQITKKIISDVGISQIIWCPLLTKDDALYCYNFNGALVDSPARNTHQADHSDHMHIGWPAR